MVYRGHIRDGRIELDEQVRLPEGAPVEVSLTPQLPAAAEDEFGPTLYERLKPVTGIANGLPPDASINVDHYLYG
ncbi:MAG: hypothetical protein Q7R41_10505, partial [Phycisphaerales bacterium]|nr:hypothetical protein [Phycisphaerales bacterium]